MATQEQQLSTAPASRRTIGMYTAVYMRTLLTYLLHGAEPQLKS